MGTRRDAKKQAQERKKAEARAKWDAMSPQDRRRTTIIALVGIGAVVGILALIGALGGNDTKSTTKAATSGTDAPSGISSSAKWWKDRACADFRALSRGIHDRTMSTADVIRKLGKMADNTKSLAQVDTSFVSWDTAVRRLKVDFEENRVDSIQSDTTEVAFECA